MAARKRPLPQPWRLVIAATYLAMLGVVSLAVHGSLAPPPDISGLWFYAAFASLVLGQFLNEPFFATPSDSLANGVALFLAVLTAAGGTPAVSDDVFAAGKTALFIYAGALVFASAAAILLKDRPGAPATVAGGVTRALRVIGTSKVVFGLGLWASAYAAFASDSVRLVVVLGTWAVIFVAQPLEVGAAWLRSQAGRGGQSEAVVVAELHDPGLLIASRTRISGIRLGDDVANTEGDVIGQVADLDTLGEDMRLTIALRPSKRAEVDDRLELSTSLRGDTTIGYVSRGSKIDEIRVRAPASATESGLREGRLLRVSLGADAVLYQVTAAAIDSDSSSEMHRDVLELVARKIGRWDPEHHTFIPVAWLPAPGTQVELVAEEADYEAPPNAIGKIPGSSLSIPINVHRAVTHNTAILGILGIGKTTLAYELVHRMLLEDIKVVALDITDQYAATFRDVWPEADQAALSAKIEAAIAGARDDDTPRGEFAGNEVQFRTVIREILNDLNRGSSRLLILNPAGIAVTRRDGGLNFSTRKFPLARMTMVEVTRVIAEEVLRLAQATRADVRQDDSGELLARFCLVLEEAHSLVPEWNSTADKAEQHATNGTVRAILQGRKFGFGCLLLTQRTANVTKSILNQCNSVIAMQIFDSTGVDFLRNYIGETYAHLLAVLEPFHAVVFGRAFSTRVPLIVTLNKREAFEATNWAPRVQDVPPTNLATALETATNQPMPAHPITDLDSAAPADDSLFQTRYAADESPG